jgi:hypothetical protein
MPVNHLTEREHLTIELALIIEDPAGVEQLDLAAVILDIFQNRPARQCELMIESLWRWSRQWPRNCPDTERSPKAEKPDGS